MKTIACISGGWAVDPDQIDFGPAWWGGKDKAAPSDQPRGRVYPALLAYSTCSMHPHHPGAHFRSTGSEESPGLAGISAKELMEGDRK